MYPANRLGDLVVSTCNNVSSGPFTRGSSDTFVDNLPAERLGDPAVPGIAISGSSNVFINSRPGVRRIDRVICGVIIQASTNTFYG